MKLPEDLREALSAEDFAAVQAWWRSLTPQQQLSLSAAPNSEQEHVPLPIPEEPDPADELLPFYEYLINHELRVVNFAENTEVGSSYRIVSSYISSLGSDYRHGKPGTVQ